MEKTKVAISGIAGTMGRKLVNRIKADGELSILCGYDREKFETDQAFHSFTTLEHFYDEIEDFSDQVAAIIDFSLPECTMSVLHNVAIPAKVPMIIATTGLNPYMDEIEKAAEYIPIFISSNMSLGVNVMCGVVREIAKKLPNYEVEIIEAHHNRKKDAPSGTALTLADSVNEGRNRSMEIIYGRNRKREDTEIGITSVRGGNIVGDHTVMFIGANDIIEVKHHAQDRALFADGAIAAAKWIRNMDVGLYGMKDMSH